MLFDKNSFNFGVVAYNEDYKWLESRNLTIKPRHKNKIVNDWHEQLNEFYRKGHVTFFFGENINDDEVFVVDSFELPTYLQDINVSTILDQNSVNKSDIKPGVFRGVMGLTTDHVDHDLMLFQIFHSGRQLMNTNISWAFDTDEQSFKQVNDRVISFRTRLTAVYQKSDKRLLFQSFRDTNSLLNVRDHFQPLSDREIREILGHSLFTPENIDEIVSSVSYYNAVRFALIKKSGVLDRTTTVKIKDASEIVKQAWDADRFRQELPEIRLAADESKVIFPVNKTEMRHLLKLLNDEYVVGLITGDPYHASGRSPIS